MSTDSSIPKPSAGRIYEANGYPATPLWGALDLGSNSFRLLLAARQGDSWRPVADHRVRVGLARGMNDRNELSREAIARAIWGLRGLGSQLDAVQPSRCRVVATDAVRRSGNRQIFLDLAERVLGVPVEVVSGAREAALIYRGAVAGDAGDRSQLVLDIGGGSTEVAVGRGSHPARSESFPLGCVPLGEAYFPAGELTGAALQAATAHARESLEASLPSLRQHGWDCAWGASGTLEAVMAIGDAHGALSPEGGLTPQGLASVREVLLAHAGPDQRASLPGVGPERAALLPGGFAILTALYQVLGIEALFPARGSLREGLIEELIRLP
jgi:exopolyphosphatase/guanosine-5'-triphosphate,3'-diphosphate pyrophosphatase